MKHAAVVIDINEADPIVIPLDEEVSNNIYYRSMMFRIIWQILVVFMLLLGPQMPFGRI